MSRPNEGTRIAACIPLVVAEPMHLSTTRGRNGGTTMERIDPANVLDLYQEAAERADARMDDVKRTIWLAEGFGRAPRRPEPWIDEPTLGEIQAELHEFLRHPYLRSTRPIPKLKAWLNPNTKLPDAWSLQCEKQIEAAMVWSDQIAFGQIHRITEKLGTPSTPPRDLGEACRGSLVAGLQSLFFHVDDNQWRLVRCAQCSRYVLKFSRHGQNAKREFCLDGRCNSLFYRPTKDEATRARQRERKAAHELREGRKRRKRRKRGDEREQRGE